MKKLTLSLLSIAILATGCDDYSEGVESAEVGEAQAEETAAPASEARETLTIDTARSSVGFTGAKVSDSHAGTFGEWSGTIDLDPNEVTASRVNITIQMASVDIEPERLEGHLKSEDFFDVENHPEATFTTTAIEARAGENGATHRITGNLSLHGQTKSISFPAKVEVKDDEVATSAEFVIKRQDFGIVYPGMPDDLINDDVVIRFDVHAPRS
ncbi:MAG: hypothetical protein CMN30_25640 [Sandaracinus sp.]|nr:hypothetical protein [Sandaracinus sp.]|tara:strand:- start:210 stop:848 length:639 start_codon:yes stop_codon:yes gene_type:complete